MAYCEDTDLDLAFGQANVRKWADVNNNGVNTEIVARIAWAIANADDYLNSKLRKSRYQFPLADDSTIPPILKRMSAYKAGVLLYESRGITDVGPDGKGNHALLTQKQEVDEFIRDIHGRRVELIGVTLRDGAVASITEAPTMVCFPDPGGERVPLRLDDNMINTPPTQFPD